MCLAYRVGHFWPFTRGLDTMHEENQRILEAMFQRLQRVIQLCIAFEKP